MTASWPSHPAKRVIDVIVAVLLLALCAPILVIVAVAVRVSIGRPVFFTQQRTGLQGRIFVLWKFRSMGPPLDAHGNDVPEEQRLGRTGRWLRATSLDELPQLVHVVRGDMSLVGPRPLLPRYLDRYSSDQARRHDVRPGLTGLAQVNGRNALSWDDKFLHDVRYVEHASFAMDLRILAATLRKVVRPEGIAAAGHATTPDFLGSETIRAGDPPGSLQG
jgi:lipopolysaccharide/colanic/teichoic acid biosynthesis glycosyltransferase